MSAKYTVFIDESFHKWFGLPRKESNFCYAALSIPSDRLADLDRFEKAIRQFAFSKLPITNQVSPPPAEFKSTDFKFLSHADIDQIAKK
ncbi:MAG TPA: hypothetical protein VG347_02875 [Verrucomicrobiae bacterium]|nr:hypothetical protein [Verrucomicrobiae bacterium]